MANAKEICGAKKRSLGKNMGVTGQNNASLQKYRMNHLVHLRNTMKGWLL
jgi:hypothetical protein